MESKNPKVIKIMTIFANYGYTSQRSIAKEIIKKGHYPNPRSLPAFINQIFSGKRRVPVKLEKALIDITDKDIISKLNSILRINNRPNLDYLLFESLDNNYNLLSSKFLESDTTKKIEIYLGFEELLKKYIEV